LASGLGEVEGGMSSKRWLAPWKDSADMIIMMKGQAYHHGQSTRFNILPAPPVDCRLQNSDG
jgi:homoserine acetyltransferase